MARLRRLCAETAVKDGVRWGWCARLRVGAHDEQRSKTQHGWLNDTADKDWDKRGNLRRGVIGVFGICLAMAHAERLLAIELTRLLIRRPRHVGTAPHPVHRLHRFLLHCFPSLARARRAGISGRCQLN